VHELSVCQALIAQVEQIAAQHAAQGVKSVHLRLGPLAGVEAQLLQDAYPIACAGSVAAESVLVIDLAPLQVKCQRCGQCGDYHTQVVSGDEMLLMRVELLQGQT
jgi:hydrogenase nickel incorporation protein HypA/HybF